MKDLSTTEAVIGSLRALLPEMQTRFFVKRLLVYGLYANIRPGTNPLGGAVDLIVETTMPLGTDFMVLRQWLETELNRTINIKNRAMMDRFAYELAVKQSKEVLAQA